MSARRILVTSALPYANGDIHLGHLLEYIQSDIWVRFQKMRGNECHYVCADDAHGTPIMLKAKELGIAPETLIRDMNVRHREDFADFMIDFSHYHSTHSEENRQISEQIYQRLDAAGLIHQKTVSQAFDPEKKIFLPDRFIRGTCPKCQSPDQYGDNCEACGATYEPFELKNPKSVLSGTTPVRKKSLHYFFDLARFEDELKAWVENHVPGAVANKLSQWFENGLRKWDISRDAPYFGFEIPGAKNKYFYVWLDAPIGYMASFKNFCDNNDLNFDDFFAADAKTELHHFIGKDIVYFHALFWPAILMAAGFRTPSSIFVHGFLTINGEKMSKSRGTFIQARTYLKYLNPEYLRYYYAYKLSEKIDDIDLNLDDFQKRVNADLIGKVVNIASRCSGFVVKKFNRTLSQNLAEPKLYQEFIAARKTVEKYYEARNFHHAMRTVMALADRANQYIDEQKPWQKIRFPEHEKSVHEVASTGLNFFRVLMTYLKPVLPRMAKNAEDFLNISLDWEEINNPLLNHKINRFKTLMTRIEAAEVEKMMENSKTAAATKTENGDISIADFAKIDLRVAEIIDAEEVPGADKLLKLQLNIGDGRTRQVFAGVKKHYDAEKLRGKLVAAVVNLAPKKMRFGISEGMILAAGDDDSLHLIAPDSGARAGMKIR